MGLCFPLSIPSLRKVQAPRVVHILPTRVQDLCGQTAAHLDATPYRYPPCWGFVVFTGDINGAAEYHLDFVQDCKSSCVVCALWDPRIATLPRNYDTRQERPSPTHRHIRWGCTTLSAPCQVTMCSQRTIESISFRVFGCWHVQIIPRRLQGTYGIASDNIIFIHTSIHDGVILQVLPVMWC